jgi:uncharacterized membrane protein YbhN (UPF0104 family)
VLLALAGSALSAVLLVLALRGTDWRAVGALLARADWTWLVLAVLGEAIAILGRALTWRVLLLPTGPASLAELSRAMTIGLTVNNLLPARIGEPVRAAVVALWGQRSMVSVLATQLVEATIVALLLVVFGTVALSGSGSLPWFTYVSVPLVLGSLAALVALAVLARRPPPGEARRLSAIVGRIRTGSLALTRPPAVVQMVLWGSLSILGQVVVLWGCSRALSVPLPSPALVLTVVTMNVVGSLPSAPAALGTLEFGALGALALFDVPRTEAVSVTLLFHTVVTIPVTLVGVVLLSRLGVGITHVREQVGRAQRVMAKPPG